jgi:hypothetical protein
MGSSPCETKSERRGVLLASLVAIVSMLTFYTGHWIVESADTSAVATVTGIKNHGLGKGGGPRVFYKYELEGDIYTSSGEMPAGSLVGSAVPWPKEGDVIQVYVSRRYPAVSFTKKPDPAEWYAASVVLLAAAVFIYAYGSRG